MKILINILALLIASSLCSKLLVTKEYTQNLMNTVTWEVQDYESNIFKGWTVEEAKNFLGLHKNNHKTNKYPRHEILSNLPNELSWEGSQCDHGVKNQGNCGSCWAFAATGMLAHRCCQFKKDEGWLSAQELVSCDESDLGCTGGMMETPIEYIVKNHGLVHEDCFPYQAQDIKCPYKCVNGKDWKSEHVCNCVKPKSCETIPELKSCLASGPVTVSFDVCRSFFSYKSGIYRCDKTEYLGGHATLAMGYGDQPECYTFNKNSWSAYWGDKGYFKMACDTCDYEGGYMCETVN